MDVYPTQGDPQRGDEANTPSTAPSSSPRAYDTWTSDTEFFIKYEQYKQPKVSKLPLIGRFFRKKRPRPNHAGPIVPASSNPQWPAPGFFGWLTSTNNRIHKIGTMVMLIMAGLLIYLLFLTQQASVNLSISLQATQQAIGGGSQQALLIITATSSVTPPATPSRNFNTTGNRQDRAVAIVFTATPTLTIRSRTSLAAVDVKAATETATATATVVSVASTLSSGSPAETSTPEPANTLQPTSTALPTFTAIASPTEVPIEVPTNTPTPTETPVPTATDTDAATETPVSTDTPVPTATSTATETPAPTDTPTAVPTNTPVPTETLVPTATATNTATETPVPTDTPAPADTPTEVPTNTPSPTETPAPTDTPVPTATNTATETPAPTDTPTAVPTNTPPPTETSVPTATTTSTATETPAPTGTPTTTPTATNSPTPIATETSTATYTPTETPTITSTPKPPATATSTATDTPTAIPTIASVEDENALGVPGEVIDIVDGETIIVRTELGDYKIGYLGIDIPDSDLQLVRKAKARNEELALGRSVYIYGDSALQNALATIETKSSASSSSAKSQPSDGRLMRYVLLDDGVVVNIALVEEGYASIINQNAELLYGFDLKVAQRAAIRSELGIWKSKGEEKPSPTPTPLSATSTPAATATPVPTETAPPTAANTATTTPIATATSTLSPTNTPLPTSTATLTQAAEPSPTATFPAATSTATATSTVVPRPTATAIATAVPTNTIEPTASPTVTPFPSARERFPELQKARVRITGQSECGIIASWNRETNLSWQPLSGFSLPNGFAYEPVVWGRGEDPFRDSFGFVTATRELSLTVDGRDVLRQTNAVRQPEEVYQWGVLLVVADPYERITLLSEPTCPFKVDADVE